MLTQAPAQSIEMYEGTVIAYTLPHRDLLDVVMAGLGCSANSLKKMAKRWNVSWSYFQH